MQKEPQWNRKHVRVWVFVLYMCRRLHVLACVNSAQTSKTTKCTAPNASRKIYTWYCHLIRYRTGGARDTEHWCKVAREQYLGLRLTRLHPHVAVAHETLVFLPSAQTKACGEQLDLRDHCRHHPNWKHVILEEGRLGDVTNSRK